MRPLTTFALLLACCSTEPAVVFADSPPALAADAEEHVYRVFCSRSNGRGATGTAFLHRSGFVFTAAHVVGVCVDGSIRLVRRSGLIVEADFVAEERLTDLAVLVTRQPLDAKLRTGISFTPRASLPGLGDELITYGYPHGHSGREPKATLVRAVGVGTVSTGATRVFVHGKFLTGNSGGPVIDVQTGFVVGVVNASVSDVAPSLQAAVTPLARTRRSIDNAEDLVRITTHMAQNMDVGFGVVITPRDVLSFLAMLRLPP